MNGRGVGGVLPPGLIGQALCGLGAHLTPNSNKCEGSEYNGADAVRLWCDEERGVGVYGLRGGPLGVS